MMRALAQRAMGWVAPRSDALRQLVASVKRGALRVLACPSAASRLQRLREDVGQVLCIAPAFVARDRKTFFDARDRTPWAEASRRVLESGEVRGKREFHLRRFCLCCNEATPMLVDYLYCGEGAPSGTPNWRERLVCSECGMNNRQRLVAKLVQQFARHSPRPGIYLMEQVTPIFEWVGRLPGAQVHGSEYLGHEYQGGVEVQGVRHEDVMNLSFADASFDLIVSNDVLEHVPDPERALRECLRVLKPGGNVLATFPFHVARDETVVRARVADGQLQHLMPAQYHGNPVSPDGSLVFQDFGWSLLELMKDLGFSPAIEAYSSDEFGHLGEPLLVFRLTKPASLS